MTHSYSLIWKESRGYQARERSFPSPSSQFPVVGHQSQKLLPWKSLGEREPSQTGPTRAGGMNQYEARESHINHWDGSQAKRKIKFRKPDPSSEASPSLRKTLPLLEQRAAPPLFPLPSVLGHGISQVNFYRPSPTVKIEGVRISQYLGEGIQYESKNFAGKNQEWGHTMGK